MEEIRRNMFPGGDCFAAKMARTARGGKILASFCLRLSKQSRSKTITSSISHTDQRSSQHRCPASLMRSWSPCPSRMAGEREEKRRASHKTFSYMGIWHQNHMRRQLFRPKCAMLEAEKNRGCTGSFGSVPIQPQTGVHPRSGHTRHSPV
jgi:hypothetical protein